MGRNLGSRGNYFSISTSIFQLVYWDEKSFYVEHQIVRQRDNFVCAVNISENAVVPSALTPQQVVDQFGLINKPRLLPEVEKIIDANSMNSERMKKLA